MKYLAPPRATVWTLALLSCAAAGSLQAHAAEPTSGVAYVSNQSGDVSVVDLATMEITGKVDAYGKEPRGIGVTADGRLLVVANREGGRVAVIDRATGKLLRHVPIGSNPEFVRVRGHMAFVSYEPSSNGNAPRAPGAKPPAQRSSGAQGKGSDDEEEHQPAHIAIVDLDKGKVVRSIKGGLETEGIEFAADGKHLLVTNEADNSVTVHEIATGRLVKTVDVKAYGNRPRGIKMAPDGKSYVVTLEFSNVFVVLDGNYDIVKTVKTGESPYGVAFDRSGERLFVAAARSKLLQVFDAKSYSLIKEIPTGARCWHFSFTPDDRNILVACGRSNEIVVIDAKTLEPIKHIADAQTPWGIVTYPKAVGSLDRTE